MTAPLTVVPLGPGDPSLMTLQSADALRSGRRIYLRTAHHPAEAWLKQQEITFESFDSLYDRCETFEEMNGIIADRLLKAAAAAPVIYAVPDPSADTSVRLLLQEAHKAGTDISVLPGVSAADSCLAACGFSKTDGGILVLPASEFIQNDYDPSLSLLLTEIDTALLSGEVKLKLSEYDEEGESEILFLPPSERADRKVSRISLQDLDRQKHYNQTAAVFIPGRDYLRRKRFCFRDLQHIMERLRARDGCPWDQEQTHASLRPYLVEEAWEAVDAINADDTDHLSDELGDVLLQVVFHSSIAASYEEFSMTDVVTHICRKMIIRHPHLFTGAAVLPAQPTRVDTVDDWEKIKREETGSKTVGESLNDVSTSLPALKYAAKVRKKLEQWQGCEQSAEEILKDIRQLAEKMNPEEKLQENVLSSLLIDMADLCRLNGTDGEILLHGAVDRLKHRWQEAEKRMLADGKDPEKLTGSELMLYLNRTDS